jgi:hypothetical protein
MLGLKGKSLTKVTLVQMEIKMEVVYISDVVSGDYLFLPDVSKIVEVESVTTNFMYCVVIESDDGIYWPGNRMIYIPEQGEDMFYIDKNKSLKECFSEFNQIPNLKIGNCSECKHISLLNSFCNKHGKCINMTDSCCQWEEIGECEKQAKSACS